LQLQTFFAKILCMTEEGDEIPALRVKQLDADALRAVAHPLRMRIVGALRLHGPATSSGLAERLGVSSGLTSYHLRALADAGFVEDDPEHPTKGRERWWRAAHDMTSWRAGAAGDDPDAVAAEDWLSGYSARRAMAWIDGWLERRSTLAPEWLEVSGTSDYVVEVSPTELDALLDQITELVRPYLRTTAERLDADADQDAAEGRIDVRLLLQAFPRGPDE
jgi:DNA-binding transcriptional ArsR family regulator